MSYQLHESTRTCQANVPLFKLQALVQLQAWQESLPSWGPWPAIVPKKRGPRTAQTHSQSCLEAFHACHFALLLVNLVRVVATCCLKQTHPSVVVLRHAPLPTCLNSQEKQGKPCQVECFKGMICQQQTLTITQICKEKLRRIWIKKCSGRCNHHHALPANITLSEWHNHPCTCEALHDFQFCGWPLVECAVPTLCQQLWLALESYS